MTIHRNSITAWRTEGRRLHSREIEILAWAAQHTGSHTDRMVGELMGFAHRSEVQPRISTLVADGYLYENGKTPCHVTGKPVRTVRISQKGLDLVGRFARYPIQPQTPSPATTLPPRTDAPAPTTPTYTPTRHIIPENGQCALFR